MNNDADARIAFEPPVRRCLITGNLCGTDTRPLGEPCQCDECRAATMESRNGDFHQTANPDGGARF